MQNFIFKPTSKNFAKLFLYLFAMAFLFSQESLANTVCEKYLELGSEAEVTAVASQTSESLTEEVPTTSQPNPEVEMVRIYAGPGVVIPRELECDYCGTKSLMPARLTDPRITILNTTSDIAALREQSGGNSPDFIGAAIRCTNCAGHSPLWEIRNNGEAPRPAAKTTRLEIHTDPQLGKRYVNLPKEYQELARSDSEMNRIARAQHIAVCPYCSVTGLLEMKPPGGVQCSGCGNNVPATSIFNTGELLAAADKARRNLVNRTASGPGDNVRSRRNIQPAPEKLVIPTEQVEAQARSALSRYATKWIASGVTALAILSGSAYYMNNTPVIAEGAVFQVKDNIATVRFQETPYYDDSLNIKTYEVDVILSERRTLPGEQPIDVLPGDRVTIHYTWSDFHFLPFVFHPYSGAEMFDGSIIDGEQIN